MTEQLIFFVLQLDDKQLNALVKVLISRREEDLQGRANTGQNRVNGA